MHIVGDISICKDECLSAMQPFNARARLWPSYVRPPIPACDDVMIRTYAVPYVLALVPGPLARVPVPTGPVPGPRPARVPGPTWGEGRGEMLPSINFSSIKRNGFERQNPKPRFDYCVTMIYHNFNNTNKMIPRSIHTFWYKGSAENKQISISKKAYISQK